jgi:CRISPR/Cas system Type II protein with McrA/HNH and RuvC-like nuclease domain
MRKLTEKILGLDLGENSIGWALVESPFDNINDNYKGRILGSGTIIPKVGGGKQEDNPAITRRQKRQLRRQTFRTRLRKLHLIKVLMAHRMFPQISHEDLVVRLQALELDNDLRAFFAIHPYEQRRRAAAGEKLSLYELGRVFYHLAQRRGYKENRIAEKDDKESRVIFSGDPKADKRGIDETQHAMGSQTLGQYLAGLNPHKERIRNRYTLRSMYLQEFNTIWEVQKKYYPELLTDELKHRIGDEKEGVLFFQRPLLKPPKSLVRKCTFEFDYAKDKNGKVTRQYLTACPKSSPLYELFTMHQFINNLRIDGLKISELPDGAACRQRVIDLFNKKDVFTIKELKKVIKPDALSINNYADDEKRPGNRTIVKMRKLFNHDSKKYVEQLSAEEKETWKKLSPAEKERRLLVWDYLSIDEQLVRWHVLYSFDNTEKIKEYAQKHGWNLSEAQLEQVTKIRLEKGYGNLSHRAIRYILPYLERGFGYNEAVILGSIRRVFGKDWQEFAPEEKQKIEERAIELLRNDEEGKQIERVKDWLRKDYNRNEWELGRLYHHSDIAKGDGSADLLGIPPEVRNPTVHKVLGTLRRLVNKIIVTYGKPDRIVIELARDMNRSEKERGKLEREMKRNQEINFEVKKRLAEKNLPLTRDNIQKWILWEECRKQCPYTGNPISFEDLFITGRFQVEHIVPRSISLDDSMANKTLCDANLNRQKSNKTPYQLYNNDSQEWENIKQRLLQMVRSDKNESASPSVIPTRFPYSKFKRFISDKSPEPDTFIKRQLNDTRYISKEAKNYLAQICPPEKIIVAQGSATALIKHYWGLDNIRDIMPTSVDLTDEIIRRFGLVHGREYIAALNQDFQIVDMIELNLMKSDANKKAVETLEKKGRVVQGIAYTEPDENEPRRKFAFGKDRSDHRHHALDAIVLACTKQSYLQKIATLIGQGTPFHAIRQQNLFPLPWHNFRADVRAALFEILIVHPLPKTKVVTFNKKRIEKNGKKYLAQGMAARGKLHNESYYGYYENKKTGEGKYHKRKPLDELKNMEQVQEIVDEVVRQQVIRRVAEMGLDVNNPKTKLEKGIFFELDAAGRRVPKVFMPNKNGDPIPVKKVRVAKNLSTARKLPGNVNRWVEPGGNYGIGLYRDQDGRYHEEVVTFWEAVQEQKIGSEPFPKQLPGGLTLVQTLQINDLFLLDLHPDEVEWNNSAQLSAHLYRVQKLSAKDYFFRQHKAATIYVPYEEINLRSPKAFFKKHPIKVRLDELGNIHPA